jgi:uncharacterized protein
VDIQEVAFSNHDVRLAGSLFLPAGRPPYPALIVLHPAQGGSRDYPFYQHLIELLPSQGMAVLIYDRRGSGSSSGDFERADFNDLAGDASAAVDYLHARSDISAGEIGLYGISQGAWIAPLTAVQRPGVAFLILVSGSGVSPARQMGYSAQVALRKAGFSEAIVTRAADLRNQVDAYYRGALPYETVKLEIEQAQQAPWFPFTFLDSSDRLPRDVTQDKWFYELDYDPLSPWQHITQPALFLFAEDDQWVPVAESMAIFQSITRHLPDVTLLRLPGTDHLMAEMQGEGQAQVSSRYVEALVAWLKQRGAASATP